MVYQSKILYRYVNHRLRYYKLQLTKTLFGEYLFIKEYGSMKYKKPTRVIKEYCTTQDEAFYKFNKKFAEKLSRGYLYCVRVY